MERQNAVTLTLVGGWTANGWPDRYVAHRRWRGWLEFKTGKRKLTVLQDIILHKLKRRGANVHVVRIFDHELVIETPDGEQEGLCGANGHELLKALAEVDCQNLCVNR